MFHSVQSLTPLFSPNSLFWRVNREWLTALAGPRAVLLELAHPAVAAGVAQHSNYRGDPYGRLYRTMKTMTALTFGDAQEQQVALQHFHHCHASVRGEYPASPLTFDLSPYTARDPYLQFWVLATLIDSVPQFYAKFVAPLAYKEHCAYYADCLRLAHLLGIPALALPPDYDAFRDYMTAMLDGNTLYVTENAHKVAGALFGPTARGQATRWFSFAAVGMVPPRLREEYGFRWSDTREKNLERLAKISRRVRPFTPHVLAIHPKAYQMEQRLKQNKIEPVRLNSE